MATAMIANLASDVPVSFRQKDDPLQESFTTVETSPADASESSMSDFNYSSSNLMELNIPASLDEAEEHEYDEISVSESASLIDFEERSIPDEDESEDEGETEAQDDSNLYGYEDARPDVCEQGSADIYGYGDATPDIAEKAVYPAMDALPRRSSMNNVPRRSSMKQGLGRRRASMCSGEEFDVQLPGKSKPVRKRASITFCETIEVQPVVPVTEMIDRVEDLWLQSEDYDRIMERSYDIVDLAADGYKYCTRGLEDLMDATETKFEGVDAVLDEQEMQRDEGTFNDQSMARLYKLASVDSQIEAKMRAKKDEKDVQKYLRDTRRYCRRLSM